MDPVSELRSAHSGEGRAIEPGLLALFRIFVVLVMALLALRMGLISAFRANFGALPSAWPGLIVMTALLGYLFSTRLQHWLGRFYLPVAVILFVAFVILGAVAGMKLRVDAGMPVEELVRGTWVLIVLLIVPLVLIAWQYGFRWVLVYCLLTAVVEVGLMLPLVERGGPPLSALLAISLVRTIVLLPVGYAVARLMDAQRRQRAELAEANARLARYATTLEGIAAERERNRLAHELHDTLAHGLSSLAVQLEAMTVLWKSQPEKVRAMLTDALSTTRTALSESRRAISALRASPLEDMGLAPALRQLAESCAARAGLELTLDVPAAVEGLDSQTEHAVYRITSEAIANVLSHADARHLTIKIEDSGPSVQLIVSDDGRGFDPTQSIDDGHFGLYGMHERARMIGAEFSVDSAPGKGTTLRLGVRRKDDTRPDL